MAKMFYTLEETKGALGRNEEEIKQLTREGRLREFRDGPRLMFKADQVEALKGELGKSKLSVRVLADALRTSPTQVVRLLEENRASKQLLQLFKLAELAGYRIEFRLRKKSAA